MTPLEYGRGWFDWESQDVLPFRWMGPEADLRLPGPVPGPSRFLAVVARHPFADRPAPRLEVIGDGAPLGSGIVRGEFATLFFALPEGFDAPLTLRLDRSFEFPGDDRVLGAMVREAYVLSVPDMDGPALGAGWFAAEEEDGAPFRWMGRRAEVFLPRRLVRERRYLSIPLMSNVYDAGQTVTLSVAGTPRAAWPLVRGWAYGGLDLAELGGEAAADEAGPPVVLDLEVDRTVPPERRPGDGRELGARIGVPEPHDDPARHADEAFFLENARRNYEEMKAGATVLSSYPLTLGVDLYGRCNISPPCVYCLWDQMKAMEGAHTDAVVDDAALEGYGPFFRSARHVVNCAFGEPLLHPRLAEIVDACARRHKTLELSSNGQAVTERVVRALVGKPVNLYVSLDAATRETYAKIRNDKWDEIVPSLVRLNEARRKAGGRPRIFLVFIPMRVNAGDLEAYFRLARRIEADRFVLRPLQHPDKPVPPIERGGYRFDFAREPLGRTELEALFREAARLADAYGVPLASQFDFGRPAEAGKGGRP